jgi:hypothetical protein
MRVCSFARACCWASPGGGHWRAFVRRSRTRPLLARRGLWLVFSGGRPVVASATLRKQALWVCRERTACQEDPACRLNYVRSNVVGSPRSRAGRYWRFDRTLARWQVVQIHSDQLASMRTSPIRTSQRQQGSVGSALSRGLSSRGGQAMPLHQARAPGAAPGRSRARRQIAGSGDGRRHNVLRPPPGK